jgi:mono/diheme cytochrome c family protein
MPGHGAAHRVPALFQTNSNFTIGSSIGTAMQYRIPRVVMPLLLTLLAGLPAHAQDSPLPPFPKELLGNPEYIQLGQEVWGKICKFCHGKTAYPGKAPSLTPSRYTPEFVYDRVTTGFRGMASFKEQFSDKERQAVTVWIMSKEFAP